MGDAYGAGIVYHLSKDELDRMDSERRQSIVSYRSPDPCIPLDTILSQRRRSSIHKVENRSIILPPVPERSKNGNCRNMSQEELKLLYEPLLFA